VLCVIKKIETAFYYQTVLMASPYLDFDAVTHSIKDVSVSTHESLASSELFRIYG